MRNDTGSPEAQVIIYALGRGEYDDHLWELEQAIRKRREARLRIGDIVLSRGDGVELMDDTRTKALQSAIVQVVRIPPEKSKITVRVIKTMLPTHYLGKVVTIPRRWVLCPVSLE